MHITYCGFFLVTEMLDETEAEKDEAEARVGELEGQVLQLEK